MATIRVDLVSENRASREILRLRSEVNNLGEQIAKNNARTASGTAEERRKTAETNRGIRAQQQLLRAQQQRQAIALAGLRQESGLLANVRRQTELLDRETRNAGGATRILSNAVGTLGGFLGGLALTEVVSQLQQFGRESIRNAVQLDSQTRALAVLTGSMREAEAAIRDVQRLADLPGLRFQSAVDGTVALRAIGVEAETTTRILTELGNAAAFSGGQGEFERGLLGFRQLIQRGRLSQEELNQLTENIGLASRVLREEFGSVLAEDIQASLDAAGQTIDDFVERTISGFERLERFPLDAPSVALNRLSNSFFEFSAAVGDQFLPILARGADGLTNFLDAITETLNGTESLTEVIADLNAEITNATGQLELRTAIEGGTEALEAFIAQAEEAIRNNSVFFGGREDAILTGQINEAREALEQYQGVQQGNIQTEADLRAELALQEAELERIQQAQSERNNLIAEQGASARRASAIYLENLEQEELAVVESIEGLEAKIAAFDTLRGTTAALEEPTENAESATRGLIGSTEDLSGVLSNIDTSAFISILARSEALQEAIRPLPPAITDVRDEFDVLAPTAERVDAIFTQYNETLGEYIRVSGVVVTSAQAEQQALDDVTQQIIQQTQDAEGLADVQDVLTQRTDAHNAALVNPAVSDAAGSLRNYANIIGDVNLGYDEVIPATQDFVDGLVAQESAFDDLRTASDAAEVGLDALDATFNRIPDTTDAATEAFHDFSLLAVEYVDDIVRAFDPLFDVVGEVGDELSTFTTLITSLATGNVLGVISSTANIVLPGLTDPQRVLDFTQPAVTGDPRQLDTGALGLTPVELDELDLSGVSPALRILLGLEGGGAGGFNVFQAQSRTQDARALAEATGTDRQAIEDVARDQYGADDYAAEVAAAAADGLSASVETPTPEEIEAATTAPPSTALQQNLAQRARFELGLATDEGDFEARRQQALLATNAFYDAEEERINALELSDEERQDQLEDNQLQREQSVHRLTNLENGFTQQRLANEREVQREVERTAALQAREAERADAEAERQRERDEAAAERAAEQAQRETERQRATEQREAERAAAQAQRDAERAAAEAERQAGRETSAGVGLLRTGAARARFGLGLATGEADFEARRQDAIIATNAYYDAELERINDLELSEIELANLRASNALDREQAIHSLSNLDNTFETQRLQDEENAREEAQRAAEQAQREAERAAAEAQREAERQARDALRAEERAERERTRAAEQAQRERQQIAERQQREEQRAIEQRLREEMRLQDRIDDLRDDAVEAETDRLQDIEDLQSRHNNRLLDLERDLSRDLEDEQRRRIDTFRDISLGYARSVEDLQNRIARRLFDDAVSFDDLTPEQRERVLASTEFQRGSFDLQQRRTRSREDLSIESGILTNPAARDFYQQRILSGELTDENLIERLFGRRGLADFIERERGTEDAGTTLERGILSANQQSADRLVSIDTNIARLTEALTMNAAPTPPPTLTGGGGVSSTSATANSGEVQVVVQVQPQDVMLDGEKVGQLVGNTIVRQGQNRRNPLGQNVVRR